MSIDWKRSSALIGILGSVAVLLAGVLGALEAFERARGQVVVYTTSTPMAVALLVMVLAFLGIIGGLGKLNARRYAIWLLVVSGIAVLALRPESVPAWSAAGAAAMILAAIIEK